MRGVVFHATCALALSAATGLPPGVLNQTQVLLNQTQVLLN